AARRGALEGRAHAPAGARHPAETLSYWTSYAPTISPLHGKKFQSRTGTAVRRSTGTSGGRRSGGRCVIRARRHIESRYVEQMMRTRQQIEGGIDVGERACIECQGHVAV